jgi:hypothetical protein
MPTSFDVETYKTGLQTLLDRQSVAAKVVGLVQEREYDKLRDGPVVEFSVESFRTSSTGAFRQLDGTLTGNLLVMVRLADSAAEASAFELALDVATALVDEIDPEDEDAEPVFAAGPISVVSIEPAQPDGALQHRVASYLITYEQDLRIRRTNVIAESQTIDTLFVGRAPDIGIGHEDDYTQLPPED